MAATGTHPLVGELVDGRYRVLRHLADGGMASVLLATDTRLDREVALKVMRPDLAQDETLVSRFRREARSAARLSHPNVVPVFDQGEDGGRVFLAMEYVEGRTARDVLDAEGALTPCAALEIVEAVLTGLAAAHEAGFIHRDVKPENVLIPDRGQVKVADFGLARAVTSRTTTANDGVLFGTVSYLSPEQVERGIADARSDVYAAGLLLFELLTGTTAIDGETPIHVAFQHVHGGVPAPSSRCPGLPAALDELVAHATAIDPDERPRDAGAYLAELRRARAALSPAELDRRPVPGSRARPTARVPVAGATVPHPRPARTQALAERRPAGDPPSSGPSSAGSSAHGPRRRRLGRLLLPLLVVAALVAGGGWWWTTEGPGSRTSVPSVSGHTADEVTSLLGEHDLGLVRREAFDEKAPKGVAITSRPGTGQEVAKGSDVTVTFSKGPERYAVPRLAGKTEKQARASLRADHLRVGEVAREWHEEVPAGQVVSTSPATGAELKRDATVDLVVSKGPQPIDVPSVAGSTLDAATAKIEGLGLKVERGADAYSTTVPKGSVVTQDPSGGTLHRGDRVTLTVSKGPEMVTVPTVEGLTEAAARSKLESAGFSVKVQKFPGGLLAEVRASYPRGGSSAPKGSTVTILVV